MALRYPPHRQQNIDQYVADSTIPVAGGSTIDLSNRTLVRISISGNGTVALESGDRDGLFRIILVENVIGSSRIENDTNIILKDRAWMPINAGEAIAFMWNTTLSAWCELWRTITYDTFTGIFVKNETGVQIDKARAVRITGGTGNNPLISLADYSTEPTSAETIGMTLTNIPHNGFGFVVMQGVIENVNTSVIGPGSTIYLTTAGNWSDVKPSSPNHLVVLGNVIRQSATVGSIEVNVDNGWELDELHNVDVSTASDGSMFFYDGALWKNTDVNGLVWDNTNNYMGINKSSPTAPLHIKNDSHAKSGIRLEEVDNTTFWDIYYGSSGFPGKIDNALYFEYNNGSSGIYITSAGNVRLISGTVTTPSISPASDTNTGIYFPLADTMAFVEGGTEAARINSSGYLGLGSTNPTTKLTVNGGVTYVPSTYNLIVDNTAIDAGNLSYARLNSNDATATNRTFTLTNGSGAGQVLILEVIAGACELLNTGNVKLSADWSPAEINDTLSLIWNGTDWLETSRSNNLGSTPPGGGPA